MAHRKQQVAVASLFVCIFVHITLTVIIEVNISGLSRLLGSPGFLFLKFSGPGKSWKMSLVLETPGN